MSLADNFFNILTFTILDELDNPDAAIMTTIDLLIYLSL
jgi:hypothetical protein